MASRIGKPIRGSETATPATTTMNLPSAGEVASAARGFPFTATTMATSKPSANTESPQPLRSSRIVCGDRNILVRQIRD
jgi:hypothetical protein